MCLGAKVSGYLNVIKSLIALIEASLLKGYYCDTSTVLVYGEAIAK